MTRKEMRELDTWLAEHAFSWVWVRDYHYEDFKEKKNPVRHLIEPWVYERNPSLYELTDGTEPYGFFGTELSDVSNAPRYSYIWDEGSWHIRREIERRGWSWQCTYYSVMDREDDKAYNFVISGIGAWAETELLAGCLALKAAIEAIDDQN